MNVKRAAILAFCLATIFVTDDQVSFSIGVLIFSIFFAAIYGKLTILVSPATVWLGAISYPLYLMHHNLGYLAFHQLDDIGVSAPAIFVIVLCGAVLAASIFTRYFERPIMKLFRDWYRQRKNSAEASREEAD